ncbi:flagellar filament capping protein FliD [Paenibacillus macerans]|uniref:flagellar filament capping protein FliD n=1 Tax=Paenibacillus macerans TaxID=44252 RepID=UPI003D32394B
MVTMRVNGFSGMDIDSMVKSMMTAARVPLDKLNQQKDLLEWQRDSYREMNSKLYDFRNNKLMKYKSSAALTSQTAAVSGNTAAVKAVASAEANGIPMKVSVTQLATSASAQTAGIGFGFNAKQSLAELAKGIKADGDASTLTDAEKEKEYTLRINDKQTMTFKGTDSVASVIAKINASSDFNVTASFDELTGKLSIKSKAMGTGSQFAFSTTPESPTDTRPVNSLLGVFGSATAPAVTDGQNAEVYINDQKIPPQKSNTITYNGIQMTLLAVTGSKDTVLDKPGADDKPFTVTTQSDPKTAIDTIKAFVEDYNTLLSLFNTKVGEEKYRDFPPLTDEQRSALSESDVKAWEEKAKSGLLKGNDILSSTIQSMRMTISEKLGNLSKIGITTGQYYEGGKLYLDEKKLTTALEQNPQLVQDLFQGTGDGTKDSIFGKLYDLADDTMGKLADRAGTTKFSGDLNSIYKEESVMGKQLKEYNQRILAMQDRLDQMETRYYKQFTAMETAMNKYNSQASSLLSSLGMSSN